ncbi:hypothetical protein [Allomesorhizobium camelthorni]|jgi:hypothetical protein|uniref:Peptide methionine sulfoxide reductase n=1 Tax=Allomesorhizobium camelthorni TaxID=475069 RepID=A0A6G4WM97_9HYPH|nr:hypothetical protein [Mesorhizobium camelthorni]NGO55891.1 hypothetical protein [Mesorhizobium camelthorni]
MENDDFERALGALADGYSEGWFAGRRYGVTVRRSPDGRRTSLFARELAGNDFISFNLYRTAIGGTVLKPCEMAANKVTAFMLGFARPDLHGEGRAGGVPAPG